MELRQSPAHSHITGISGDHKSARKVRERQHRGGHQCTLQSVKSALLFSTPHKLAMLGQQGGNGGSNVGKIPNKTVVVICQTQKLLYLFHILGGCQVLHC